MPCEQMKWLALAVLWMATSGVAMAQVDLEPYLRRDAYETIKISPDGLHFAATVPLEDRTGIVVLRRSDKRVLSKAIGVEHSAVADFWWADNKRIVVAMAQALGSKDTLYLTGELHGLGIDDAKVKTLFGAPRPAAGLVDVYGGNEREMATFIAPLPEDPGNVLIAVWPLSSNPRTRVEKLNAYTGHRTPVISAPVRRADFTVDAKGVVRFADGADDRNYRRLYYRAGADADWQLVNDQQASGRVMSALGLSADGTIAYLRVDQAEGPDSVESWDTRTQARKVLLRDPVVDPYAVIYDKDGRTPIGMQYMDAGMRSRFFDETSPMALLHRGLERAFPKSAVSVTSFTADGGLALLRVWNDRMLGDYYLYDTKTRAAVGVFARREWFDPEQLPGSRQVTLKARDGVALHGYLTVPKGREAKALPLVVMAHGGPYGIFDEWAFDDDTQLLAAAGYAVLRVNYRGSGNYGKAFRELGAQQWGGTMQDDLTDATRWAIAEGIADRRPHLHLRRELRRLRGADGRGEGARPVPLRGRLRRRLRPGSDASRGFEARDAGSSTGPTTGSASAAGSRRSRRSSWRTGSRRRCSSPPAAPTRARRSRTARRWSARCAMRRCRWKRCTSPQKVTASPPSRIGARSTRSCSISSGAISATSGRSSPAAAVPPAAGFAD